MKRSLLATIAFVTIGTTNLSGQGVVTEVALGTHVGVGISDGTTQNLRFGAQAAVQLWDVIEIVPGFSVYAPDETRAPAFSVEITGWQAMINMRVSPFGRGLYAGTGATLLRTSETRFQTGQTERVEGYSTTAHVLLLGIEVPVGRVRIFGEVQGLNLIGWENTGALLLGGVNIRLR